MSAREMYIIIILFVPNMSARHHRHACSVLLQDFTSLLSSWSTHTHSHTHTHTHTLTHSLTHSRTHTSGCKQYNKVVFVFFVKTDNVLYDIADYDPFLFSALEQTHCAFCRIWFSVSDCSFLQRVLNIYIYIYIYVHRGGVRTELFGCFGCAKLRLCNYIM